MSDLPSTWPIGPRVITPPAHNEFFPPPSPYPHVRVTWADRPAPGWLSIREFYRRWEDPIPAAPQPEGGEE